jgi:hypothetical protein
MADKMFKKARTSIEKRKLTFSISCSLIIFCTVPVVRFTVSLFFFRQGKSRNAKEMALVGYPACPCPDKIQERDQVFEKLRMMSLKNS